MSKTRGRISIFLCLLLCALLAVVLTACGGDPTTPIIEGKTATISEAWGYQLAETDATDQFWIATEVRADKASDDTTIQAGAVFASFDGGDVYLFVAKHGDNGNNASIYMVARKDGSEIGRKVYHTALAFDGTNHKIKLDVVFSSGIYYVGIDDEWSKIGSTKTADASTGTFDFFATGGKRFGVAATLGTAHHEKIEFKSAASDVNAKVATLDVNLVVNKTGSGTASLDISKAFVGDTVRLTATPTIASNERIIVTVQYDGKKIQGTASGSSYVYDIVVTSSTDITVSFEAVYQATGSYSYAAGLYIDGDIVTVESYDGIEGTVNMEAKTFEIYLPVGEQEVILSSSRFEDQSIETTIVAGEANALSAATFSKVKLSDGKIINDGKVTLQSDSIRTFAGVTAKNFYAKATVQRMDDGEATGGIAYYAGSTNPVKILVLKDGDNAKIRLTRGTGWNDRDDRDYETSIAWKESFTLEAVYNVDTLYIGIDGSWFALKSNTPFVENPVTVGDFDAGSVWNNENKTFGLVANGASDEGFPFEDIAFEAAPAAVETKLNECFYTINLSITGNSFGEASLVGSATGELKVLKRATFDLSIKAAVNGTVKDLDIPDNWERVKLEVVDGATIHTIVPNGNGTIEVEFVEGRTIQGSYAYTAGLYTEGDVVTILSETGNVGTVNQTDKTFTIKLATGMQKLILRSSYYADVEHDLTVTDNVTLSDPLTFEKIKFSDGSAITSGNYTLEEGDRKLFAGAEAKNFYAAATVTRVDGETTSGIFFYAGSSSPVNVFLLEAGGKVKIRVNRGTDWDTRRDRDYATDITWNNVSFLEVISSGDVLYVGIGGIWHKIESSTSYTDNGNIHVDFNPATVWNANADKTFGLFVNGRYESVNFPISNIGYSIDPVAVAAKLAAANATLTLSVVGGEFGTATLGEIVSGLKGFKATLTVKAGDNGALGEIDFKGLAYTSTITADGATVYTITVLSSQQIVVTFSEAYTVSGSYDYAAGLYTDGDEVTVSAGGNVGTVDAENKTFTIRLAPGTHTVTLVSSMFASVTADVAIVDANATIAAALEFTTIKFSDGSAITDGSATLKMGNYKLFAGAEAKNFYAAATVKWIDGESTSGIYFFAGNTRPVKIMLFNEGNKVKLHIRRGVDGWGGDRRERNYLTNIAWNETLQLEVISSGDTLYIGIEGNWFAIKSDTAYDGEEGGGGSDFDASTVWNASADKTFGIFANGGDANTNFPVSNINYSIDPVAVAAKLAAANATLTLSVVGGEFGTATLGEIVSGLKGFKATLTVKAKAGGGVASIDLKGLTYTSTIVEGATVYTITVLSSQQIVVTFSEAYTISGSYDYDSADGVGDVVTVSSGNITGTVDAEDKTFTISLINGTHTVILSSVGFEDQAISVTVSDDDVVVTEPLEFAAAIAFSDGAAITDGSATLKMGNYKLFAGATAKDFYAAATVKWIDGESTSGIYFFAGNTRPVKIMLFNDGNKVKLQIRRGVDGWGGDRRERNYLTNIAWNETLQLEVISSGDTLYIGIEGNWFAIKSDTAYDGEEGGGGSDFDASTVWNASADKTFGIFANGGDANTNFPVSNINYSTDPIIVAAKAAMATA